MQLRRNPRSTYSNMLQPSICDVFTIGTPANANMRTPSKTSAVPAPARSALVNIGLSDGFRGFCPTTAFAFWSLRRLLAFQPTITRQTVNTTETSQKSLPTGESSPAGERMILKRMQRPVQAPRAVGIEKRSLLEAASEIEAEKAAMPPMRPQAVVKTAILIGESKKFVGEIIEIIATDMKPLTTPPTWPTAPRQNERLTSLTRTVALEAYLVACSADCPRYYSDKDGPAWGGHPEAGS